MKTPPPLRGRGSATNPKNRFESIERVPEPPEDSDEVSSPQTQFFPDSSKSIIAYNESPDVGFDASINPYRGCEHGCVYCLSGETPILMADGTMKRLDAVQVNDEIIGTVRRGWYRYYAKTRVLAHWLVKKTACLITLEDGTEVIASEDHRFLTERGWKFVSGVNRPHLTENNKLMGIGAFARPPQGGRGYRQGYLCGMIRGDGLLASYEYTRKGRVHGNQHQFRLALADDEALKRTADYLAECGIETHEFTFQKAANGRRAMSGIRTHAQSSVNSIRSIISWPLKPSIDWHKGFLAGIFDAEGSYSSGILRIINTNNHIIEETTRSLHQLGLSSVVETRARPNGPIHAVRLVGGLRQCMRFFHAVGPAIARKCNFEGQAVKHNAPLRVAEIKPLRGRRTLFDITTGTGDFIANGVVSHNCYARPTHEYLGFSAGLDFETKIMVKDDAPELLRKELSSPKWKPQLVALSGNTDCYQPVEKQKQLTRRCLEVFLEYRNPVVIVTKNHLVTRDIDILSELAKFDCIGVTLSLTTLDHKLASLMEPRASRPARRLDAIKLLADAGVPVGYLQAPMIPGLTDSEAPAIALAAAKAGATFSGYVALRLPFAVKELFEQWLGQHYPDKKEKILHRVREIRGGKLNDANFKSRMRGEGIYAQQMAGLFQLARKKSGITERWPKLTTEHFRRPEKDQLSLF